MAFKCGGGISNARCIVAELDAVVDGVQTTRWKAMRQTTRWRHLEGAPHRDDLGYRIWRSRVRGTRWRRLAGRGCKPRASMRPWTLVLVVLRLNVVSYNTVIEGARQTDVDVTCSSVIHACVT